MPKELIHLNEQLLNLKVLYEDAILSDKPIEELKKINAQIKVLEKSIADRKEFIKRQQSTN